LKCVSHSGIKLAPWLGNDTTPTTPAAQTHHPPSIEAVKLSPVQYRSLNKPDEQAFIGFAGLQKLRMHVNTEKQQLEIKEVTYVED